VLGIIASACSANPPPGPGAAPASATSAPATASAEKPEGPVASSSATPKAAPSDGEPLLLVTDPTVLALVEQRGLALGELLGEHGAGAVNNERLAKTSRYSSVADVLAADIALVAQRDPQAGVGVHRFSHRLFDVRWLRAGAARFELVAAVNRFDRAPFHDGGCGETRLVYRLSYATTVKGKPVASRLPMTLGLEVPVPAPPGGCSDAMRRWVPPSKLEGEALAAWLTGNGGPLETKTLAVRDAKLVVNAQQVRWPSAVRPDLAGHAEYLLRAFRLDASGAKYMPVSLENTPDLERFAKDPNVQKDFVAWLGEPGNLASVDRGTPLVPERFLAKRSVSVTPRGLARRTNRPFSSVLGAASVSKLDFSKLERVRSPEGLLRRLDELSCQGCHEARSVAGFHLLGDDPEATPSANAVATGVSPHLAGELVRRRALARAALAKQPILDFSQPYPERGDYSGYGAHCGLGADASFAGWTCAPGLACRALDAPASDGVGQCLPSSPLSAGDPCETGPLDARRDRIASVTRAACAGDAACNTNAVGFPGGMCTETCGALSPGAVCGSIAVLDPFNACVARGEPFFDCLANNVRPAGFRACDAERPCRDDYICTRGNGARERGACIPPYFLFQLRVDGHP
jgi:hypothetical protein